MADKEVVGYTRYYQGSCLVKFEKTYDDYFVTEIRVKNGKAFLVTVDSNCEIIEEHELGIIDTKPLDLNVGNYGTRKED